MLFLIVIFTLTDKNITMNNRMWNVNGSCPICLISYHTYPLLYEELSILFHFYSLKRKGHNSGLFMRLQWSKYRFLKAFVNLMSDKNSMEKLLILSRDCDKKEFHLRNEFKLYSCVIWYNKPWETLHFINR